MVKKEEDEKWHTLDSMPPDEKNNKALHEYEFSFEAEMKKAYDLFDGFDKIDYLKCDIEGYERVVIP